MAFLDFFSTTFGWIYLVLTISGMLVQNVKLARLGSTQGFSTDFAIIAFLGFLVLLFNQVYGLVDPYSDAGRIHALDVFSFLLTFASSALALVQTIVLPSDPPYRLTLYLWTPLMLIWLLSGLSEGYLHVEMSQYAYMSWITYAAYLKALSTLMKYSMQIWHNYVKQSVVGVSHQACWIDFAATCSAWAQM